MATETETRLEQARATLHTLLVDRQAITSSGAAGVNFVRNLESLRSYVKDLEIQLQKEQQDAGSFQWDLKGNL